MTTRILRLTNPLLIVLLLLSWAITLRAQTENSEATKAEEFNIGSVQLIDVGAEHYVRVDLSHPFARASMSTELAAANVSIKFLPSGITVPAAEIVSITPIAGFGDQTVQIELSTPTVTKQAPNDKQVQVIFQTLHFKDGPVKTKVTNTGPVYDSTNINDLVAKTYKALQDAVANAKTPDECAFCSGFNITVPSGKGSKTEGSGDLVFNRTLVNIPIGQSFFDQINFGLKVDKATEVKADPRHFEMGLQFRKVFLFHRAKIKAVRDALDGTPTGSLKLNPTSNTFNLQSGNGSVDPLLIINDLQKDFFRSLVFDNGLKFEGDIKGFGIGNVSNLLFDSQLQLTTVSRAIGSQAGFFNFRWIPFGVEAGYNLKNDDDKSNEKHSLARIKTGAVFSLFYRAKEENAFLNRVEFDTQAINRFLLLRENVLDPTTRKATMVEKGSKYWLQSDLKFMFGPKTSMGMVGIKVGFRRGSLPPVYAFNKAFNIGLVFESADKDNSKEIKLK
jgi:hypothetical protein